MMKQQNVENNGFATIRIGRILPDKDDDTNGDYCDGTDHKYQQEQLGNKLVDRVVLLQAVEILTKLASMDSVEFQHRLVSNTLPSTNHPDLIKLNESIHRLKSSTVTLTKEYDQQTAEVVELQKHLNESQERVVKLEKAATKLHRRNIKLKKKNKSDKSFAKKLVEQVQQFRENAVTRKEDEEFYRLADKVQQHEQSLMRQRTDSICSDLDSVVSSVSGQSLVTDDGIATLKIHRDGTLTWPPRCDDEDDESSLIDVQENPYSEQAALSPLSPPVVDSNPFAKLLTPRQVQPYSLTFLPPCSLQFVALHVEQPPSTDFGTEPPTFRETAFCVCGYYGFDTAVNVKPTLGARLLAINSISVNPSWTIHELESCLDSLEERRDLTFRNDKWDSKQKEILNHAIQEQKRIHPSPQKGVEGASPFLRMRTRSRENNKSLLGFFNFQHPSSSKASTEQSKNPSTTPGDRPSTDKNSRQCQGANPSSPNVESCLDDDLKALGLEIPGLPEKVCGADNTIKRIENGFAINLEESDAQVHQKVHDRSDTVNPANGAVTFFRQGGMKMKERNGAVEGTDLRPMPETAVSIGVKPRIESGDSAEVVDKASNVDSSGHENPFKPRKFKAFLRNTMKASGPHKKDAGTREEFEEAGLKAPSMPDSNIGAGDFVDAVDAENGSGWNPKIPSGESGGLVEGKSDAKGKIAAFWKKHSSLRSQEFIDEEGSTEKPREVSSTRATEAEDEVHIVLESGRDEEEIVIEFNSSSIDQNRRSDRSEIMQNNFKGMGKFFAFR